MQESVEENHSLFLSLEQGAGQCQETADNSWKRGRPQAQAMNGRGRFRRKAKTLAGIPGEAASFRWLKCEA